MAHSLIKIDESASTSYSNGFVSHLSETEERAMDLLHKLSTLEKNLSQGRRKMDINTIISEYSDSSFRPSNRVRPGKSDSSNSNFLIKSHTSQSSVSTLSNASSIKPIIPIPSSPSLNGSPSKKTSLTLSSSTSPPLLHFKASSSIRGQSHQFTTTAMNEKIYPDHGFAPIADQDVDRYDDITGRAVLWDSVHLLGENKNFNGSHNKTVMESQKPIYKSISAADSAAVNNSIQRSFSSSSKHNLSKMSSATSLSTQTFISDQLSSSTPHHLRLHCPAILQSSYSTKPHTMNHSVDVSFSSLHDSLSAPPPFPSETNVSVSPCETQPALHLLRHHQHAGSIAERKGVFGRPTARTHSPLPERRPLMVDVRQQQVNKSSISSQQKRLVSGGSAASVSASHLTSSKRMKSPTFHKFSGYLHQQTEMKSPTAATENSVRSPGLLGSSHSRAVNRSIGRADGRFAKDTGRQSGSSSASNRLKFIPRLYLHSNHQHLKEDIAEIEPNGSVPKHQKTPSSQQRKRILASSGDTNSISFKNPYLEIIQPNQELSKRQITFDGFDRKINDLDGPIKPDEPSGFYTITPDAEHYLILEERVTQAHKNKSHGNIVDDAGHLQSMSQVHSVSSSLVKDKTTLEMQHSKKQKMPSRAYTTSHNINYPTKPRINNVISSVSISSSKSRNSPKKNQNLDNIQGSSGELNSLRGVKLKSDSTRSRFSSRNHETEIPHLNSISEYEVIPTAIQQDNSNSKRQSLKDSPGGYSNDAFFSYYFNKTNQKQSNTSKNSALASTNIDIVKVPIIDEIHNLPSISTSNVSRIDSQYTAVKGSCPSSKILPVPPLEFGIKETNQNNEDCHLTFNKMDVIVDGNLSLSHQSLCSASLPGYSFSQHCFTDETQPIPDQYEKNNFHNNGGDFNHHQKDIHCSYNLALKSNHYQDNINDKQIQSQHSPLPPPPPPAYDAENDPSCHASILKISCNDNDDGDERYINVNPPVGNVTEMKLSFESRSSCCDSSTSINSIPTITSESHKKNDHQNKFSTMLESSNQLETPIEKSNSQKSKRNKEFMCQSILYRPYRIEANSSFSDAKHKDPVANILQKICSCMRKVCGVFIRLVQLRLVKRVAINRCLQSSSASFDVDQERERDKHSTLEIKTDDNQKSVVDTDNALSVHKNWTVKICRRLLSALEECDHIESATALSVFDGASKGYCEAERAPEYDSVIEELGGFHLASVVDCISRLLLGNVDTIEFFDDVSHILRLLVDNNAIQEALHNNRSMVLQWEATQVRMQELVNDLYDLKRYNQHIFQNAENNDSETENGTFLNKNIDTLLQLLSAEHDLKEDGRLCLEEIEDLSKLLNETYTEVAHHDSNLESTGRTITYLKTLLPYKEVIRVSQLAITTACVTLQTQ